VDIFGSWLDFNFDKEEEVAITEKKNQK